jgi:diaminopimelate epimerase
MDVSVRLTKHHALGNDFLVALNPEVELGSQHAVAWCDRRRGIGADGLLIGTGDVNLGTFAYKPNVETVLPPPFTMVLYNADGSRAEMSGNGIRCLAQAFHRTSRISHLPGSVYRIGTDAGVREVAVDPTEDPTLIMAKVSMGAVADIAPPARWHEMGCDPLRPVAHLSLGNPHSIIAVDDVFAVDLVEAGSIVPEVNLEIVQPGPEPHAVTMRVHERGAGITEACGTGASAVATAAVRWGLVDSGVVDVLVHMDGGDAWVRVGEEVVLTGSAAYIGSIEVPWKP